MTVYQILVHGEEGQTFAGDIFWLKSSAEKEADKMSKDDMYKYCSVVINEKQIVME